MRFALYLVVLVALSTFCGASAVRADTSEPMTWFQALNSAQRLQIQQDLYWTGDYKGKIDGSFGPATSAAILAFQQHHKLSPTGVLSADDLANLSSESGRIRELVQYHISLTKRQVTPLVAPKKKVAYYTPPARPSYAWPRRLSLNSILILP